MLNIFSTAGAGVLAIGYALPMTYLTWSLFRCRRVEGVSGVSPRAMVASFRISSPRASQLVAAAPSKAGSRPRGLMAACDPEGTHLEHLKRTADQSRRFERRGRSVRLRSLMEAIGRTVWAIAEGYIPGTSTGPGPAMTSHETACLLNAGDEPADVAITIFFKDREPAGPYRVTIGPRRTLHLRFNDLRDPEPIPRDTDYASLIQSTVRIVVQHTRLDSRQSANALLSTIAWSA